MVKGKFGLKLSQWLKRYLPLEIFAVAGALLGGSLLNWLFGNPIITALGATWGENIGYYGKIIIQELRQKSPALALRNILLEFGPAECLDSFLVRPATMYFFPKITGNLALGIILGKFSADIIFYVPTIISYELKNKYLK